MALADDEVAQIQKMLKDAASQPIGPEPKNTKTDLTAYAGVALAIILQVWQLTGHNLPPAPISAPTPIVTPAPAPAAADPTVVALINDVATLKADVAVLKAAAPVKK